MKAYWVVDIGEYRRSGDRRYFRIAPDKYEILEYANHLEGPIIYPSECNMGHMRRCAVYTKLNAFLIGLDFVTPPGFERRNRA